MEQERQIRFEISNRNSVLGVMLHETIDHAKISSQSKTNDETSHHQSFNQSEHDYVVSRKETANLVSAHA